MLREGERGREGGAVAGDSRSATAWLEDLDAGSEVSAVALGIVEEVVRVGMVLWSREA